MTRSGLAANGDELVVLGEKLTNPFTVENMQVAYNSLKREVRTIGELDISAPTHKYIKFMPQDSVQLELIEADTTLDLYSYPLDYKDRRNTANSLGRCNASCAYGQGVER